MANTPTRAQSGRTTDVANGTALAQLAHEINQEHEAAEHARNDWQLRAIRVGELLVEAKSQLPHGAWLPWLAENFPFTPQTARGYMRIFRHQHDPRMEDAFSIRSALAMLAKPVVLSLRAEVRATLLAEAGATPTRQLVVTVPSQMAVMLDQRAAATGVRRSQLLRMLILLGMQREPREREAARTAAP